ncbi:MAG: ABC transporter ATP-binding protein, partial [Leptospiraceae bacterium]|nr:ABC transporter ATP-binding protein [Leptospiraceae bacterium]
ISHDPDFLKGLCNKTFRLSSGSLENLNCSFEDYLQVYEEEKKGEVKAIKATKEKVDGRSSQNPDKKKQRKLEKDILTAEERIDTLEKEKSLLENDMADPDFYSSSQRDTILKRYEEIKPEIEKVISDWEALQLELEELKL